MVSPNLRYVSEWVVEEAAEVGCCGDIGTYGEGILGICDAVERGTLNQVLGIHSVIHRRQLASSGTEYARGGGGGSGY